MGKSILDQLLSEYDTFTASEKKIADFVLRNQRECMGIGITELAALCGVAVSTVSLFCRKLKLSGFNDFKLELARASTMSHWSAYPDGPTEVALGDGVEQVRQKACARGLELLRQSAERLDGRAVERAVDMLTAAEHVLMLGQGNHSAVALIAWSQFSMTAPKFQTVQDSHLQTIALANLRAGDVVLYFSYSGATMEIMDAVKTIRQVGARLILVTRFGKSPAAEFADVVLISGADERPLQFGSINALMSQLYVVDVLLECYCLRCSDHVIENRAFIGKELSRKHL